jgi:RNA polymerase sigma-70 factor (TIGR02960 family)
MAADEDFARLTDPFRAELLAHCYRMLGSVHDAEDQVQETMIRAWRSYGEFEGRASLRTWLYRIATSRCLNALRSTSRRPPMETAFSGLPIPEPTGTGEVPWLEPFPDVLLDGLPDDSPGPDVRYESHEAISLAFVTALQTLPPRQRAVMVLRDVLGYRAAEVAELLDSSEESVTSALKRARATLGPKGSEPRPPAPRPGSPAERDLVERLTRAYETNDLDGVVALLSEDVRLTMPPLPLEYCGRELAARFFAVVAFRPGRHFRLVPTRANGQPALAVYVSDPTTDIFHANGILVLTLAAGRVSEMARFDNSVLPHFGLPRTLTD